MIKSEYQTDINQPDHIKKNYETYKDAAAWCDTFFVVTNKATYPAGKYKEIQDAQQYFQQKAQKYKNITPQDAVDFINKVLQEFSRGDENFLDRTYHNPPGVATLDGCTLTITTKSWVDDMTFYDTLRINLSSVYLKTDKDTTWICSATRGDIWGRRHITTTYTKRRGKETHTLEYSDKYCPLDRACANNLSAYGDWEYESITGVTSPSVAITPISSNSPTYKDQAYDKRLAKALGFLIVNCGGGKLKNDDSKF